MITFIHTLHLRYKSKSYDCDIRIGRRCYYIEILHLRGVSGYQWQWKAFCKALAHARPQGINLLSRSLGVATYPYLILHGILCSWKIQCVTHVSRRVSLVSLSSLVSYPKLIIYQRHGGIICKDRQNEAAKMTCHLSILSILGNLKNWSYFKWNYTFL